MQTLRLDAGKRALVPVENPSIRKRMKRILPGIIAGAADLDPAAVMTATVAGASFGYSIGWVVLVCVPVLFSVFAVSSRLGHQTRKGLVELLRENYGCRIAFSMAMLIVVVNMAMIIGDIVVVSDSISLLTATPRAFFLAPISFTVWYVLILGSYQKTTKVMGILSLLLIAYVAAAWHVTDSAVELVRGILAPRMQINTAYMMAVIAVFGSLLTPDVIVWQTSSKRGLPEGLAQAHVSESHAGTFVACLISLSAIVAASHLHVADPTNMSTRSASQALGAFGAAGPILFSLGILGSGLIALPVLVASLCFSVAEAFNWRSGLAFEPWNARMFYVMISLTVLFATAVDFFGIHAVTVLYWSQVLAGASLIPIFVYILLLSNNPRLMRTTNSLFENLWLGAATLAMVVANALFLWQTFR
jgi:Mn2+/Fe2+ NRAMP family transporter